MRDSNIKKRLEICKKCPIYAQARGICNSALWINPKTDETSDVPKAGYVKGCGCAIFYKVQSSSAKCVAGKW